MRWSVNVWNWLATMHFVLFARMVCRAVFIWSACRFRFLVGFICKNGRSTISEVLLTLRTTESLIREIRRNLVLGRREIAFSCFLQTKIFSILNCFAWLSYKNCRFMSICLSNRFSNCLSDAVASGVVNNIRRSRQQFYSYKHVYQFPKYKRILQWRC